MRSAMMATFRTCWTLLVQTTVFTILSAQQSLSVHGDSPKQLPKADGIADIPDLLLWSKIEDVALKARHRRGREH